jgi:hypothetical protein
MPAQTALNAVVSVAVATAVHVSLAMQPTAVFVACR